MKRIITLLFILTLFENCFVFAQQQLIKGKVGNENNQPVAGASVFVSNTSKGTVTSSSGEFSLHDVPAGKHELVVSSIGYETFVQSFSNEDLPLQLNIKLKLKVKELAGVTVIPFEKDGWAKYGKLFLDNFIGTTDNAADCKITNYKSIRFRFLKKEDKLTALALEPLVIVNKALGYRILYQLEEFQIDYKNNSMMYLGYPLFEEMGSKKRWKKEREKVYEGSVMNFMRCLYNNKLQEQGFEVKRLKKIPNTEKQRIKEFFKPVEKKKRNERTGEVTIIVDYDYERFSKDSVAYYERVLRQKDFFDVYGASLLTADSLITKDSSGAKFLLFADYIFVTCRKIKEEMKYLQSIMETNRKPFFQRSSAILSAPVAIEANGNYYSPQDFFSLGYWGWSEKMANTLPFDYERPQ